MRLGELSRRSGSHKQVKNLIPLPGIKPRFLGHPVRSLIAILTGIPAPWFPKKNLNKIELSETRILLRFMDILEMCWSFLRMPLLRGIPQCLGKALVFYFKILHKLLFPHYSFVILSHYNVPEIYTSNNFVTAFIEFIKQWAQFFTCPWL
jgi:hypothetical protein